SGTLAWRSRPGSLIRAAPNRERVVGRQPSPARPYGRRGRTGASATLRAGRDRTVPNQDHMVRTTQGDPMIEGTCTEQFAVVRDTFEANFTNGLEVGASVAVAIEGELVVDLWGGVADEATGRPWAQDTIVNVFSSTKPMIGLVTLM